jgi:hypothetical protein
MLSPINIYDRWADGGPDSAVYLDDDVVWYTSELQLKGIVEEIVAGIPESKYKRYSASIIGVDFDFLCISHRQPDGRELCEHRAHIEDIRDLSSYRRVCVTAVVVMARGAGAASSRRQLS